MATMTGSGAAFASSTLRRAATAKPTEPACCVVRHAVDGRVSDDFVIEGERFEILPTTATWCGHQPDVPHLDEDARRPLGSRDARASRVTKTYDLVVEAGGHAQQPLRDAKCNASEDIGLTA